MLKTIDRGVEAGGAGSVDRVERAQRVDNQGLSQRLESKRDLNRRDEASPDFSIAG
jgi:hypothetical protein